jgi:hypothetical protein
MVFPRTIKAGLTPLTFSTDNVSDGQGQVVANVAEKERSRTLPHRGQAQVGWAASLRAMERLGLVDWSE